MKKLICKFLFIFVKFNDAVKDRYYPRYHLAPPQGWMNDPNGFCVFNNEYHLFYQHNPHSSQEPGIIHWGHAKSTDLFHWQHLNIAMFPDQWYDKNGVFSGSALVENDTIYLFYTGNVNYPDKIPDHEQLQALAKSTDGVRVIKYDQNPIISAPNRQPNIRDPKVWKHEDKYYMVLGNSFNNDTLGRVLLYISSDKINWNEAAVLDQSDGELGYMWECPNFFQLGDLYVLLFSPQGIEPEGDKYRNLYQTGYIIGKFNYRSNKFTPITKFRELDNGHDFYATQTIEDSFGRTLLVAWLNMWEEVYPERNDGFSGQMTIVRELTLSKDGRLIQSPVEEVYTIRGSVLHSGPVQPYDSVTLENKAGEVYIETSSSKDFWLQIASNDFSAVVLIYFDSRNRLISLDRGGDDGFRRTNWDPIGILKLRLFIDASSIEMFCGLGEVTFSSRFFPDDDINIMLLEHSFADNLEVYSVHRTTPKPN